MKHHGAVARHCLGVFLAIAGGLVLIDAIAADQQPGEAEIQSSFYTYHDDWAIVSAPPPPGPYQSVNVDPRIPGQEDVRTPFLSGFNQPPRPWVSNCRMTSWVLRQLQVPRHQRFPVPIPDRSLLAMNPLPDTTDPADITRTGPHRFRITGGDPTGIRDQAISRYGYTPSPWSNPPLPEDAVPPPPVYRNGPVPDQFYRRGTGTQ